MTGHYYPWESYGGTDDDHIDGTKANYSGSGDPFGDTSPVGYYDGNQLITGCEGCETNDMANGYGIYDMAGNLYEWCWDWYQSDWYSQAEAVAKDTHGPEGPLTSHVLRGGSYGTADTFLRCANRFGNSVDSSSYYGFRCVRRF